MRLLKKWKIYYEYKKSAFWFLNSDQQTDCLNINKLVENFHYILIRLVGFFYK